MHKEILVIDDNPDIRLLVSNILKDQKYDIRAAANYDQAIFEINKKLPDLAIIDIKLDKPDKDGIDLLKYINKKEKSTPVIMISGHATVQIAVEAIRLGAYEFIEKPFSKEKIINYVNRALESSKLKKEKDIIENKLFHSFDLIGKSSSIVKVRKIIEKLSTTESRILITGPTGTGKELVARKIHKNSSRSKQPFVIINAALLKENAYEKELFGEELEDGSISFGALERANNGTLLIDEVSEIPYETQANVLRVLIDQKFKRLNGSKDINVNIRLISSTSKNLNELVNINKFREDLFHRLNVVPIKIPNLSERVGDIPILAKYFAKKLSSTNGLTIREFSNEALTFLQSMEWPGNIRQLKNLIERVLILGNPSEKISSNELILSKVKSQDDSEKISLISTKLANMSLREAREIFERDYLILQINRFGGNISKTASFVEMERSALHRKLKSLGITTGQKI